MTQIFRVDNPMLGRGLSFGQRVCYLNAMMHFFFGIPRFIFLTAPLAYLLFRLNIIAASGLMVIAYALPHLWHATITNSRLQSRYRHSFWGEIYESVLALYILKPTITTLINPKRGKFNVTEKGGLLPSDYFDYKIVRPQLIVCGLLLLGLVVGVIRWFLIDYADTEVLLLNIFWAAFNLLTIAAAIAVAREARQVRGSVRHDLVMPAVVHLPNGRTIVTQSRNMSTTGGQFTAAKPEGIGPGDNIELEVMIGDRPAMFPARIVGWAGDQLRLMFTEMTVHQQRDIVRIVLCRADAWLDWEDHPIDQPLRSVSQILRSIGGLFVMRGWRSLGQARVAAAPVPAAAASAAPPPAGSRRGRTAPREGDVADDMGRRHRPRYDGDDRRRFGPDLAAARWRGAGPECRRRGQPIGCRDRRRGAAGSGRAGAGHGALGARAGRSAAIEPDAAGTAGAARSGQRHDDRSDGLDAAAGADAKGPWRQFADPPARRAGRRQSAVLGAARRCRDRWQGRCRDRLLSSADPRDQPPDACCSTVRSSARSRCPRRRRRARSSACRSTRSCSRKTTASCSALSATTRWAAKTRCNSTLWLVLSNTSAVTMQLQKLTLANELSLLPAPFYDSKDMQSLTLPFVFSGKPAPATLQAAGITASWFGSLASYKGATFPVSFDTVPAGNAVVFATNNDKPSGVQIPSLSGPTISVVPNPNNPEAKLLLVMGRTPEELTAAAQTLALGSVALSGQTQVVGMPEVPARQAYDAPRWIPMDRPVRFGELVQPTDLQGNGLVPGLLTVNFRTAPDIFVWGNSGVPLMVRYRYPAGTWLNFSDSRLDVSINNSYLRSLPMTQEGTVQQVKDIISPDFAMNEQTVRVPPYYVFGQNQLQFYYDLRPMKRGECQDVLPNNVQESIDPDSTIDLSKTERFTTLPNLAFFVNSGYPFTKFADLSQTAVVVPDQLSPADVQTYLTLMGMMGDSTGFPVARVTVVGGRPGRSGGEQGPDRPRVAFAPATDRQVERERAAADRWRAVAGGDDLVARTASIPRSTRTRGQSASGSTSSWCSRATTSRR